MTKANDWKITRHVPDPLMRWENGHQMFFVLIQALIIIHKRLESALSYEDWQTASECMTDATQLWWACAAAFHFTGDFTQEAFDTIVRPSMAPPHEREGFSGLFSVDHGFLLKHMKTLKPLLLILPPKLKRRHRTYLWGIDAMYESHAMVCELHVGNNPSLKMEVGQTDAPAPDVIRNLKARTLNFVG